VARVVIVDYGLGNLRSVLRGIEKAGGNPVVSADPAEVGSADAVVLPGVGAFREGMEQLGPLKEAVVAAASEVPFLGICLGMQMLLDWSEEHGLHRGLGLVPGTVKLFPRTPGYKIPHMGWNSLSLARTDDPLFAGFRDQEYMYFVHSYYADTTPENTVTVTDYIRPFASTIGNGRVYGVQFHPEKSGPAGLRLLENYIGMC
jgi:glutamine amidotransferase